MRSDGQFQDDGGEIMERLATRVRAARAGLGLSRRALSERSGVSPRYLAQIEAGAGNISVVLLDRVARALDVRIEDLVRVTGDTVAAPSDPVPDDTGQLQAERICLMGLPGAGKSTLGVRAAEKLKIRFIELRDVINGQSGAVPGREGPRESVAQALDHIVATQTKVIVAVPFDIVDDPVLYGRVLERFHTVWLHTSPAEHMARLRARAAEDTPLVLDEIRALLEARRAAYERAFAQLDTASRPVSSSVNELLAIVAKHRLLTGLGSE